MLLAEKRRVFCVLYQCNTRRTLALPSNLLLLFGVRRALFRLSTPTSSHGGIRVKCGSMRRIPIFLRLILTVTSFVVTANGALALPGPFAFARVKAARPLRLVPPVL
jgi:hypothetical protein